MREFNALSLYPQPTERRSAAARTIQSRLVAHERSKEFFDGDRANGYGGLTDDGRWLPVAQAMIAEYGIGEHDSVLQINAEKGFLLEAFRDCGVSSVRGTETSHYAAGLSKVKLDRAHPARLPYPSEQFKLVLAIGAIYTLSLVDAMRCLRQIERVKRDDGASFVTLGAYETEADYWALRAWSLLGTTLLPPSDWLEVLRYCGYSGDYAFVTARTLNL